MSIFQKIFGAAPTTIPATNPPPGATQNHNPATGLPGTVATQVTAPNGIVPETKSAEPVSPLDAHKDVWQTPTTEDPPQTSQLFAGLDPKKVMESARGINFAQGIDPAIMEKINAGGPEAITAALQAMNAMAQGSYGQSALATTKIVEKALEEQRNQFMAQLPTLIKRQTTGDALLASNPILSNPAIQPLVGALSEQLQRKNPNATAADIQAQVMDYFGAVSNVFAPKTPETPQSKRAAKDDWSKFLI